MELALVIILTLAGNVGMVSGSDLNPDASDSLTFKDNQFSEYQSSFLTKNTSGDVLDDLKDIPGSETPIPDNPYSTSTASLFEIEEFKQLSIHLILNMPKIIREAIISDSAESYIFCLHHPLFEHIALSILSTVVLII